jgi:hypothetical protein
MVVKPGSANGWLVFVSMVVMVGIACQHYRDLSKVALGEGGGWSTGAGSSVDHYDMI